MSKSIGKAIATVFVLSLVAKIIGFLKFVIQASYYGVTVETDAFNVANEFVNNILYMLTMAVSVAFVPLYIQHKKKHQSHEEKVFATRAISILFMLAIFVTVGFIFFAPFVIYVIAPSYSGNIALLTIRYFRVLVLGFAFSLVANMYNSLLNAEKIYGFSAFSSVINSVVIIIFAVFFQEFLGVWALVISVPVSYAIQWVVLYLRGKRYAVLSLNCGFSDESIKLLVFQSAPILLSQASVEINQVVDRALLTGVAIGALTSVTYAAVLFQFAWSLIAMPLSTVLFTELSEAVARVDFDKIKLILQSCYKFVFIICVPIVASMYFCSFDIVKIVYGHGKYPINSLYQSSIALQMYGLCLLPACIKAVLSKAYYSLNDTRRPMIMGIFEVILKVSLSITLVKTYGIVGVVGSTAIASIAFVLLMLFDFNNKYLKVLDMTKIKEYWKIVVSSIVLICIMYIWSNYYIINHYADFIVKTFFSFVFYFGLLSLLKEELFMVLKNKAISSLKKRITFS